MKTSIGMFAQIAVMLIGVTMGQGAGSFDSKEIDRRIEQMPICKAEAPLYGLLLLGAEADPKRIWMVLDKSNADQANYDVLHIDLNGNGDLTEKSERILSEQNASNQTSFHLDEIKDKSGAAAHTDFILKIAVKEGRDTHMLSVLWRGKHKIGGGYPEDPDAGYMQFAHSPELAPIIRMNGDGPFRFQRWYSSEFLIGGASQLKVFLGLPGAGESSFCAFQKHVLPAGETVSASLIYRDIEGKEQQSAFILMDRC